MIITIEGQWGEKLESAIARAIRILDEAEDLERVGFLFNDTFVQIMRHSTPESVATEYWTAFNRKASNA